MNKAPLAETLGKQSPIENQIGSKILQAAISIHREIGCGLLESVYQMVLREELERKGYKVGAEKPSVLFDNSLYI